MVRSSTNSGAAPDPARRDIRWAVLGTARIAQTTFAPGVRQAGGGTVAVVAGRDRARTQAFAHSNGIPVAVTGYQAALDRDDVDAVYVALPNAAHPDWSIAALRAGKAVLCEKPLSPTLTDTTRVLDAAERTGSPLWESFAFLFGEQTRRLLDLVRAGGIGDATQIVSSYHYPVGEEDIRFSAELAGGSLADLGCYPVRLARLIFGAEPVGARVSQRLAPSGVDAESWGVLDFPRDRRLLFSCGFSPPRVCFGKVLGTAGEIDLTMPFGAGSADVVEVRNRDGAYREFRWGSDESPFVPMLRHIHAALRADEPARYAADADAAGNAAALDAIRRSATDPAGAVAET